MDKALFFVVFILGIVVGSIFVLTAHNCCCELAGSGNKPGITPCCSPAEFDALKLRIERLERIKVGTAAPE